MRPGTRVGRRRSVRTTVIVTLVGGLIVAGLLVVLVQNMSQGATALSTVKEQTSAGLLRETERAEEAGGSLDVSWSTTPQPDGDSDTVLARIETRPSGALRQALFLVEDGRVTPVDELARELLSAGRVTSTGP